LRRLFFAALATLSLGASLGLPAPAAAGLPTPKVAIIVGPVGKLTPTYLALAERAAAEAERHGATVARAYSPNATPANVLAAVEDANVVIYFGHGYGHPSPYGGLDTSRQNGWGLQGPTAYGTHDDGLNGPLQYYGEDWIVANARPAPGFVMIYSNTCYAPGASEGGFAPATPTDAALRVAHYSRPIFALGGSAYYATDFDGGAADLVGRLLADRTTTYGNVFSWDPRFAPAGLSVQAHPFSAGQAIWLHHSKYAKGPANYWYAFAGNPDLAPLRAWDAAAPTATLATPGVNATDVVPTATLEVRFSEDVSGASARTIALRGPTGRAVPATVTYDPASRVATVRPEAPLALSRAYSVAVTGGIADVAGRPVAPVEWPFTTRLDADPLAKPLAVVLESGAHVLEQIGNDGRTAETRTVEVVDRRWTGADVRARLPGRAGSWLRIADAELGGWWVAESPRAHALGQVEEAILAANTEVAVPRASIPVTAANAQGPQPGDADALGPTVNVRVDRRRVVDGRTELRLADPRAGGAWIAVTPAVASTEPGSVRILAREERPEVASVTLPAGQWSAFRFDESGRVIARRALSLDDDATAVTLETLSVAGVPFIVLADGDLAGWAVAEDDRVVIRVGSSAVSAID
jgi:hypothetical protein